MPEPLTIGQALNLAQELLRSGRPADAAQVCGQILDAAPELALALHLLALAEIRQGNAGAAVELLQRAVRADPRVAEAHNDLGNLQQMTGALDEAVSSYQRALQLKPDYADAHRNVASALRRLGRLDEAVNALETAVAIHPGFAEAIAQLVHQLKQLCDWRRIEALTQRLITAVEANSAPVNPFVFLSLETTPSQQLQCARQWSAAHFPVAHERPRVAASERITVGYLSADYQEHATAHLIAELFVLHDRSRFRVIGYSYGRDDGSSTRRRMAESFDEFVDLETASHADAAARIREDGAAILVDLKGYTTDARPEIAALRPAPIQVSYLGYPGTLGNEALDYILVDPYVVPGEQQVYFTEQLVQLPDCYQVNDRRRAIAARVPTRAECGLPESGFVFCCLSAPYKITAPVFDTWMRLLEAVPGSVLWLLEPGAAASANLRREAEARFAGGAERLVWAPSLPNPEHLARLGLADLFLDTLPYNAHTLTSDALWVGCPVVTCSGNTFPSRVAGSLLQAVGLPELVTNSLPEYEALALRLAREEERLRAVREKLRTNRLSAPLFDSARWTRHVETAYAEMWRRYQAGEEPTGFAVSR